MEEKEYPIELTVTISRVRKRARATRRFAQLSILGIVFVAGIMLTVFFISPVNISYTVQPTSTISDVKTEANSSKFDIKEQSEVGARYVSGDMDSDLSSLLLINTVSSSIVRLGAVFLSIFVIQVLVNFTRYNFRIADHLDSTADVLEMCPDLTDFQNLISVISPKHIDFGKPAAAPIDQAMELAKELATKIPRK